MRTPGPAALPPEIAKGATPATAYGHLRLPPVTLRVSGVPMRRGSHGEPSFSARGSLATVYLSTSLSASAARRGRSRSRGSFAAPLTSS